MTLPQLLQTDRDDPAEELVFENETLTDADFSKRDFRACSFLRCRFAQCSFAGAAFYDCVFHGCDLSNCALPESYWKGCRFESGKMDGAELSDSRFKAFSASGSSLCYTGFSRGIFERARFTECLLREANLSEVKLRDVSFSGCDLTRAELLRTPLRGIDLSGCEIGGLLLSDSFRELRGAKLSAPQAVELARALGVEIV